MPAKGSKSSKTIISKIDKSTIEEIKKLFLIDNYRIDDICTELKIPREQVVAVIRVFKLKKTKEQTIECTKRTNIERYGVDNPSKSNSTREKIRKTNLKRYGVEHSFQAEEVKNKIVDTMSERYGVRHNSQIDGMSDRKRQTYLEHYGVDHPLKSEEVQDRVRDTNLDRYGSEWAIQSDSIREKVKDTNLRKYGVENILSVDEVRDKAKRTMSEKYGVEYASRSPEIQEKIKSTSLRKYGTESPMQSDIVKEKTRNTNISKYGVPSPNMTEEVKSKIKDTRSRKYGIPYLVVPGYSKDAYDIISDRDKFIGHIMSMEDKDRLVANIAKSLGISYTTCLRYCSIYNLFDIVHKYNNRSSYEDQIADIFSDIYFIKNSRRIIYPYELDLYNEELKLGIEFNGSYWHSAEKKPADYHQKKSLQALESDIFVYHIFEYEWDDPRRHNIIISQLTNLLHRNGIRIYARNCEIREVSASDSRKFLHENHIQGYRNAKYRYGLYYNSDLVSLMTFSQDKFILKGNITGHTFELVRFCSKIGYSVIGGASKLFSHFVRELCPDRIISYCDIAKGRGVTYKKLGFELSSITAPNYHWVKYDGSDVRTRYQCQPRFIRESPEDRRTETEIMCSQGYYQIFDCGSYKFIWNK